MRKMITVNKNMITVRTSDFSDNLSLNHCNQKITKSQSINHCNQFTKKTKGQSIMEYAMFITVVVLALLAMQVYLKRGLQGKIKDMADQISPALYNPSTTNSTYSTNTSSETRSSYTGSGVFVSELIYDSTNRTGIEYVYPETY